MLKNDAPYLVSILVGALAWGVIHIINELVDSPTLEYCGSGQQENLIEYSVTNLSKKTVFKGLKFDLSTAPNDVEVLTDPRIYAEPPHFEGVTEGGWSKDGKSMQFFVPALHPGGKVVMSVAYRGDYEIAFRFMGSKQIERVTPVDKGNDDEAVLLEECGVITWFVKNETKIILGLIALIFISVPIAWRISRPARNTNAD